MSTRLLAAAALLSTSAAHAETGSPTDGYTWLLLVIGMVAIGVYAATRTRND